MRAYVICVTVFTGAVTIGLLCTSVALIVQTQTHLSFKSMSDRLNPHITTVGALVGRYGMMDALLQAKSVAQHAVACDPFNYYNPNGSNPLDPPYANSRGDSAKYLGQSPSYHVKFERAFDTLLEKSRDVFNTLYTPRYSFSVKTWSYKSEEKPTPSCTETIAALEPLVGNFTKLQDAIKSLHCSQILQTPWEEGYFSSQNSIIDGLRHSYDSFSTNLRVLSKVCTAKKDQSNLENFIIILRAGQLEAQAVWKRSPPCSASYYPTKDGCPCMSSDDCSYLCFDEPEESIPWDDYLSYLRNPDRWFGKSVNNGSRSYDGNTTYPAKPVQCAFVVQ